jgi:hypothetical protein
MGVWEEAMALFDRINKIYRIGMRMRFWVLGG